MNDLVIKRIKNCQGHLGGVYGLCEGKNSHFYSAGGDGYLVQWSLLPDQSDGTLMARAEKALYCCANNPQKDLVACGGLEGLLYIIDTEDQKMVHVARTHTGPIYSIVFFDSMIYSAGSDGYIHIIDIHTFQTVGQWRITNDKIRGLHLDNHKLYAACSDGFVYVIDPTSMSITHFFYAHSSSVFCLVTDNTTLYTGGRDACLKIWNIADQYTELREVKAHMGTVNSICLYNDWIITAGRDKLIRIWDKDGTLAESKSPITGGHFHSVNKVIAHHDTNTLLSASDDKNIMVWGLAQY